LINGKVSVKGRMQNHLACGEIFVKLIVESVHPDASLDCLDCVR